MPTRAEDFDHRCSERQCSHYRGRTDRGCKCHRTREQMMLAEIDRLRAELGAQEDREADRRAQYQHDEIADMRRDQRHDDAMGLDL